MSQRIQVRRGTAAAATTANPVLAEGEIGFETDTGKVKFGDGATAWNSLPYFGGGGAAAAADVTFTSTGGIAAADVQAALAELDAEKASKVAPFVRVFRSSNYTLPGSTSTVIPYDNEADDSHGFHDNSTNPSRLTVPAGLGGVYAVSLTTELGNSDQTERSAHVRLNGGAYLGIATLFPTTTGARVRPIVATVTRLVAGDYVEAISNPGAGGSGLHYYAISGNPSLGYLYFSMARIGD